MKQYYYEGPIMFFDICVASVWRATTYAASEAKARSNLMYQAKKLIGKSGSGKVTLPGKIMLVG